MNISAMNIPAMNIPTRRNALPLWGVLTLTLAASLLLPPPGSDGRIAHLPSFCPFFLLTGLPCPGCGLTRAFVCLGHGRWGEAWHWHPLGLPLYALCLLLWLRGGFHAWRGVALWPLPLRVQGRLAWAGLSALLLFGAARIGWLTAHGLRY